MCDGAHRPVIGQEISGVVILRLAEESPSRMYRRYAVRYLCCGAAALLSHAQIMDRQTRGIVRCHACGVRAEAYRQTRFEVEPFALGAVVANARIERVTVPGRRPKALTYAVTMLCCGYPAELTHHQLIQRDRRNVTFCAHCTQKQGARTRLARVLPTGGPAQGAVRLVDELPERSRPRPKIYASDIERHLARVFGAGAGGDPSPTGSG